MPEFVNSSVWSPAGTRLALGTTVWPRSAKNSTNRPRISAPVRYGIEVSGAEVDIVPMVPKRPGALGPSNGLRGTWHDPGAGVAAGVGRWLGDGQKVWECACSACCASGEAW